MGAHGLAATEESPSVFLVRGTMAAGDEPILVSEEPVSGVYPCVEIMTLACFPEPFDNALEPKILHPSLRELQFGALSN